MKRLAKLVATFFYMGHSPYVPGTVGSLGGLLVYGIVRVSALVYAVVMLLLLALGMAFAGEAEHIYRKKDAKMIVIDEVCGMLIALFLVPYSIAAVVTGFIVFRVLDIIKPQPAKWAESLPGASGIMLDDIVAAVYTNIILQLFTRVFHLF
jgi:phosphatidylglycerophosphatase A